MMKQLRLIKTAVLLVFLTSSGSIATSTATLGDSSGEVSFANIFEEYLADQRKAIVTQSSVIPIAEEIFCHLNNDCIDTTYCCSDYSCVHPSKCLHGQKVTEDTCDYNFECYSRCCSGNTCSHFLNCYKTCQANGDCNESGCCSDGYCTHDVVCAGNKVIGDSCDIHSECLSRHCSSDSLQCAVVSDKSTIGNLSLVGLIGIILSALIVVLFVTYCCKAWSAKSSLDFFSASSPTHQSGSPGTSRNGNKDGKRMSESNLLHKYQGDDQDESDMSESSSRMEQRMLLQAMTSRKLLFQTGDGRQAIQRNRSIQERYQNQVVPISEHSAENLELTFQADSQDDSDRAQAGLFSRQSQQLFTSQDEMNGQALDSHSSSSRADHNTNFAQFNSQTQSDYSNQANHPNFQYSPKHGGESSGREQSEQ